MAKLGKSQRDRDLTQVVAVAALNEEGQILFGKRGDNGKWCMPAGHLEPGEDPEEGAKRELDEESGLKLEAISPLGSQTVKGRSGGDVKVHAFLAAVSGEPTAENDPDEEFVEFSWEDPDDISKDILENLHSKKDVVLRLLGIQEDEDLAKGAMSRLAPFNPHKDVNLEAQGPTAAWQDTHDHADREAIPRMEGPARMRALHGLHGKAQVRVNSEGEREFLLHRGHNPMEPHEGRKSWTTDYFEANSKARYSGGPGGGERSEGHPVNGVVTSRWIPESKIVSIPNQLGGIDTTRPHNRDRETGAWRGGANEYGFENEIVSESMGANHPDTVVHPYRRGVLRDMRIAVDDPKKTGPGPATYFMKLHPTTLEPFGPVTAFASSLKKMALKDVPLGETLRSNDREDHFDYSHVLTPAHREAGFSLHVKFDRPKGEWKSILTHKDHPLSPRGFVSAVPADENGVYLDESKLKDGYENQGFGKAMYEALLAHVHNYHGKQHVVGDVHSSMASRVHESLARKHGMEYKARRIGVPKGRYDDAYGQYGYVLKSDGLDQGFLDDLLGRDTPAAKEWREKNQPWDDISRALVHPDTNERRLGLKMDGVTPAHLSFGIKNYNQNDREFPNQEYRKELTRHPAHNEESIYSLIDNPRFHPNIASAMTPGAADHPVLGVGDLRGKFNPRHLLAMANHPEYDGDLGSSGLNRVSILAERHPDLVTPDNFRKLNERLRTGDLGLSMGHPAAPVGLVDREVKEAILDHSIRKDTGPGPRTVDLVREARMSPEMFDKIMDPNDSDIYDYDSSEDTHRRVLRQLVANQVRYTALHNKNLPVKFIDRELMLHETNHPKKMEAKHLSQALSSHPAVDSSHVGRVINGAVFPMDMKTRMMSHPAVRPEHLTQFIHQFEPENEHDESAPFIPDEVAKSIIQSPAFGDDHAVALAHLPDSTGFAAHANLVKQRQLPTEAIERLSQLGNAEIKKKIAANHDVNEEQVKRLLGLLDDPATSSVMARRLWSSRIGVPFNQLIDKDKMAEHVLKTDSEGRKIALQRAPLSDELINKLAHDDVKNLVGLAQRDELSPAALSSLVSARVKHQDALTGDSDSSVYGPATDKIAANSFLTPEDQRRLYDLRPLDGFDSLRDHLVRNPNLDLGLAHRYVDEGHFHSNLAENSGLHPDIARRLFHEKSGDQEVFDNLSINPKTPEDVLEAMIHHANFADNHIQALLNNPSTSLSTIRALAGHPAASTYSKKHVERRLEEEDPDSVYKDKVMVRLGKSGSLGRIRKIRDLILEKSPKDKQLHPKQLPAGDWSAGRLPNGNISADKLQEHIDLHPAQQWNYSHTVWKGAQRHSDDDSEVFQLNLSNDHIRKMKEAGVWDTFKKMADASMQSSHPVNKSTIGWVRYTGTDRVRKFKGKLEPFYEPEKWAAHAQASLDALKQRLTPSETSPGIYSMEGGGAVHPHGIATAQDAINAAKAGNKMSLGSNHPANQFIDIAAERGWSKPRPAVMRPTHPGEAGYFVDEVQSDLGQSVSEDTVLNPCGQEPKKIKDFMPGDTILGVNNSGQIIETDVVALYDHGILEGYEATFDDGYRIVCSENHKFLTDQGQAPIKEIWTCGLEVLCGDQAVERCDAECRSDSERGCDADQNGRIMLHEHTASSSPSTPVAYSDAPLSNTGSLVRRRLVSFVPVGPVRMYDLGVSHAKHNFLLPSGIVTSNSFVKQAQGQIRTQATNEARQQGMNEEQTAAHVNARVAEAGSAAEKEYPEEHFKKISQIVFGGRHPNEVVAEGFVQHLRDQGKHKTQIQWHTPESKAPLSRLDTSKALPGHFNVSYNDIPKKMGAEPSNYGKLQTETRPQMKGADSDGKIYPENAAPTWNFKVRKFEDEIGPWLRSLKKSDVTKDPTRSFEVQLGYRPKRETAMAAGAMFSGKRDIESERNALVLKDGDYLAAAMQAHGISDPEALKQAMALVEAPKKAEDIETKLGDIQPATEDAKPFAEAIGRANRDGQIRKVHLDGVHSKGSYLATDPNGLTYLIKPGA